MSNVSEEYPSRNSENSTSDPSARRPEEGSAQGLIRAGDTDFLRKMLKDAPAAPPRPLNKENAKSLTHATKKILDVADQVRDEPPTPEELAFMARELVQCTLPHSDPGQVPFWQRRNGNLTLSIVPGFDPKGMKLVGYPYGSIPRLLIFWVTTEALRTGSPRLHLGFSYDAFLRELGLNPNTGGGKRSDAQRVREQTRRLFAASISFIQNIGTPEVEGERRINMHVADRSELWWNPKHPEQIDLWDSWVELGRYFYEAIIQAPVPVDIRALHALKRSPLALDLYAWATHKAFTAATKGKAQFVSWRALMTQFGADYTDPKDFKKKIQDALRKIRAVYPGLKLGLADGGILVLPTSRPAVDRRPAKRSPV